MRNYNLCIAAVVAAVVTLIIRFTVYGDDCNLLVLGMTFLFFLAVSYGGVVMIRRLLRRKE